MDQKFLIEKFVDDDISDAIVLWNNIVQAGRAFPQDEEFDKSSGLEFFKSQTYTAVAREKSSGKLAGLYILHPNNVGRCGHICNASYAVSEEFRGQHLGEALVKDCIVQARKAGYKILQFNAVVASNTAALNLYRKLGFTQLGVIPDGFRNIEGIYEDIIPHYIEL